jgi:hypothetical protein
MIEDVVGATLGTAVGDGLAAGVDDGEAETDGLGVGIGERAGVWANDIESAQRTSKAARSKRTTRNITGQRR